MYPQVLLNIPYKKQYNWKEDQNLLQAQAQVTAELGQTGRVLIRASGTEPVLRVMVEAKTLESAQLFAKSIAKNIPVDHQN